jgi:hypothetical protein
VKNRQKYGKILVKFHGGERAGGTDFALQALARNKPERLAADAGEAGPADGRGQRLPGERKAGREEGKSGITL